MYKKILCYLFVAVIAYALGTVSSLHAATSGKKNNADFQALSNKVDKVLANQTKMMSLLKKIRVKV